MTVGRLNMKMSYTKSKMRTISCAKISVYTLENDINFAILDRRPLSTCIPVGVIESRMLKLNFQEARLQFSKLL